MLQKTEFTASIPAAKSTEPRRSGFQLGFLKTKIGKVSAGLIVLILALYALMPSQENNAAAPRSEAQSKKEMAGEALPPAARPHAAETVVSISGDEFERAKLLFQSAEKLFSERKLNQSNLYDGIQKWRESRELFKKFYEAADDNANLAKIRLDQQVDEWKTEVIINYRKKDFKSAHAHIQNILAAVPAIEDSSYRWAKDREPRILKQLNGVDR
jgi:hypothetical protein